MTPVQKLKHLILIKAAELSDGEAPNADVGNIDALYEALCEADDQWDAQSEIREGDVGTDIACEWSRHYESKSVAARYPDGLWIGWTYWYGGGKHGEPEAIDWIDDAYALDVAEKEELVVVRTFTKVPE